MRSKKKKSFTKSCSYYAHCMGPGESVACSGCFDSRMRLKRSDVLLLVSSLLSTSLATQPQTDPCLDADFRDKEERLHLPARYANLTPPWERPDGKTAKIIQSDGLRYQWSWVKSLPVKGLSRNIQVEDIFQFFSNNDCLFVPVGTVVRNILLQQKAVYISGEVSCELHDLYEACVKKYSAAACALYPIDDGGWGAYRLEIGDSTTNQSTYEVRAEPIVLYEWRSKLGAPNEKQRFTVDTLAMYDDGAGDLFLIDPTGVGYRHVCDKKMVPASKDLEKWSAEQQLKLMGFYELRTDGFASQSEKFQKFVNEKIKVSDRKVSQQFYCEHVLKGVANLDGSTPVCHTTYPKTEAAKKIAHMRAVMISEMEHAWNSSIGKAAEEMEAVFCTSRQYVDIRNRLHHKVHSSHDSHHTTEAPKIIEEGRPMINDSAQVHSRPILNMDETVFEQLPAEYPSMPRAHPNEHLEFVESSLVEGAGSEPTAYRGDSEPPEKVDYDNKQEEPQKATRYEGGTAQLPPEVDHHNMIVNDDVQVMRFDKVEENGLTDAAASVMHIPTSSGRSQLSVSLFLVALVLHYI